MFYTVARGQDHTELYAVIFAKYANERGKRLLDDIAFLTERPSGPFHCIVVGYSRERPADTLIGGQVWEPWEIRADGKIWYFDPWEFTRELKLFQARTGWKYKGGVRVLLFDVATDARKELGMDEILVEGRAQLDHVLEVEFEELRTEGLVRDLDQLIKAMRPLAEKAPVAVADRPTMQLAQSLGMGGPAPDAAALSSAFGIELEQARTAGEIFRHFALRDLTVRKAPARGATPRPRRPA